jgi:peptide deformylase
VCVVNVTNPFFLLNPKIVKKEKEMLYREGCLSIPDKMVKTNRYEKIWVEADNVDDRMYFGPSKEKKYDFKTNSYTSNDLLILESVCVQHEIDHLNGLTIFDREYTPEQYRRTEKKYGRNEIITISKGNETLELKYKKGIPYLTKGWKING